MIRYLQNIFRPACYHGRGKKPPFFEGWYFKLVDEKRENVYAIIPGIFLSKDEKASQAFIQMVDSARSQCTYFPFAPGNFRAGESVFKIEIGPNRFSASKLTLDLSGERGGARGTVSFQSPKPWPVSFLSPGVMGWYAWMPFMECFHGVVSMDHVIHGSLVINEREIDFTGGRGYIEKDWGRSFPESWIWVQSNHFESPDTSLTASLAVIPWIDRSFPGFIIGLWHQEKLYRFATYTGAKIEKLHLSDNEIDWVVRSRRHRLEIHVIRSALPGPLLHAPVASGMNRRIEEQLDAVIEVRLYDKKSLLFEGSGYPAGTEAVGDLDRLLDLWKSETRKYFRLKEMHE